VGTSVSRPLAWLATLAVALGVAVSPAAADGPGPVLHEAIPPDPAEDLAMHVILAGNLPAAIRTPRGKLSAPDPQAPPSPSEAAYSTSEPERFRPDRDTRRADVGNYDDPFTPSTAPFKRLYAFDLVRDDFSLGVRDERQVPMVDGAPAGADDDSFFGDMLVDVIPGQRVRIPSVGPGARIVHAHLGVGAEDLPFRVFRDGADNWFLQAVGSPPSSATPSRRARLVMELAIPRRALGGEFNDAGWSELPFVPPLPTAAARDAAVVRAAIGVSRRMRPRDALTKLVQYFRSFTDSDDPPTGHGSVYLDLALSRKGVCRHRAFAFLITAQSLGLPARLVHNEAHAWVEVHDGWLFRRIDLGGAGRMQTSPAADRPAYEPLADAFRWPEGSERGQDMVTEARAKAGGSGSGSGGSSARTASSGSAGSPSPSGVASSLPPASASASAGASRTSGASEAGHDRSSAEAAPLVVHLDVPESNAHRGDPLRVHGTVTTSDGEPCGHATVELLLSDVSPVHDKNARPPISIGTLATDDRGVFDGSVVLPTEAPLGDYDLVARSPGVGSCREGDSP
jgi:hypothetical protein